MIKESSVWRWLSTLSDKYTEDTKLYLMLHRVENSAGEGTPDVFFCMRGISGWIELKSWSDFRLSQKIWAKRYLKAGGLLYVLYVDKDIECKVLAKMELMNNKLIKTKIYPLLKVTEIPVIIWTDHE